MSRSHGPDPSHTTCQPVSSVHAKPVPPGAPCWLHGGGKQTLEITPVHEKDGEQVNVKCMIRTHKS